MTGEHKIENPKGRDFMKLRDIMTKNVETLQPESTVLDAAKIMQAHNIGAVPVCSPDNQLIGMVTDRDIVVRNIANNGNPSSTTVDALMTQNVVYGTPDMDVHEAAHLMAKHQIRRLPVVENNRIVGIVSLGDFATNSILDDNAGQALSQISTPSEPMNMQ